MRKTYKMKFKMDLCFLAVVGLLFAYNPSFCSAENSTGTAIVPPTIASTPTKAPPPAIASTPTKAPPPAIASTPTKAPPPAIASTPTKAPPPAIAPLPTKAAAIAATTVAPPTKKDTRPFGARIRELVINGPLRKYLWDNGIIESWWTDPQKRYPIKTFERIYNATDPIIHFFEGITNNIDNFFHNIIVPAINGLMKLSPLGPIWGIFSAFGAAVHGVTKAINNVRLAWRESRRHMLHTLIDIREKRPLGHIIFRISNFSRNLVLLINAIYSFFEGIFIKFIKIVFGITRFFLGVFAKVILNIAKFFFGIARAVFQFFFNSLKRISEFSRSARRGILKTMVQTIGNIIRNIWARAITRLSEIPILGKFLKPLVPTQ